LKIALAEHLEKAKADRGFAARESEDQNQDFPDFIDFKNPLWIRCAQMTRLSYLWEE
jgi:hypothetical protein